MSNSANGFITLCLALVTILEIFICGSGRHVQVYVNNQEWVDSYSFLRWVVVPVAIFDAFWSAWRECTNVVQKEDEEAIWTDKNGKGTNGFQAWLKKYHAEITYFKVLALKLCVLPAGATMLLKIDLVGMPDYNVGRGSIFLEKFQHKSFGYIAISNVFIFIKRYIGAFIIRYGVTIGHRMSMFAMIHPKQFAHRLSHLKVAVRWLRFLAPLIGTLNKFKGGISDALKKAKQHREAKIAARIRRKLLNQLTPGEQREESARHIQAVWRARRARKAALIIKEWRNNKELSAAMKVQAIFRAKYAKMIVRQRKRQEHLLLLEEEETSSIVSSSDVKRLNKHERKRRKKRRQTMKDLRAEVRDFKRMEASGRSFLIRPNTSFSVWWKIIRVSVIFVEVLQVILPKIWSKDKKITMEELLASLLISSNECSETEAPALRRKFLGRLIQKSQKYDLSFPCVGPSDMTLIYFALAQRFIHFFVLVTNIVCFLDVPITFFTGEIHEETGTLIPKPMFQRWILPGLLLQLLINPVMTDVFTFVKDALVIFHKIDPGRVMRWIGAIFPLTYAVSCEIFDWITCTLKKIVKELNQITVKTTMKEN